MKEVTETKSKHIPKWDIEYILNLIEDILKTEQMYAVDINFHAEIDMVPYLEYTVTRHILPEAKKEE